MPADRLLYRRGTNYNEDYGALVVKKKTTCQCRRHKRYGFDPWVSKIPWRRAWQPTPVFLLGLSLAGYSPRGRKELDMTEAT